MKNKIFYIVCLMAAALVGCKDDDYNDNNAPAIKLSQTEIHWVPGREMNIEAKITDETGIRNVYVRNADFGLDETIGFGDGVIKDFALTYPFTIPEDLPVDGSYVVEVSAVDFSGNMSTENVNVYTDGDIDPPVFETCPPMVVDLIAAQGMSYTMKFGMSDNRALASLAIVCDDLGIDETVGLDGTFASFSYEIPLPDEEKNYTVAYTLADEAGFTVEGTTEIRVSKSPDFDNMFLTDVFTDAELRKDAFGVPAVMDKKAPYEFEMIWYNRVAGAEYLFIPDDTTLDPHVYGLSEDGTALAYGSTRHIVLEKQGYYHIAINTMEGTLSVEEYDPGNVDVPEIYIVGENLEGFGSWDLSNPDAILQPDPQNKYLLSITVGLVTDSNFKLATAGWGKEWVAIPDKGATLKWSVKTDTDSNCWPDVSGRYRFEFDYITGLSSLIPE